MKPSELVRKVDGALLQSVPVSTLAKANITSLNQVANKKWRLSQVKSPNLSGHSRNAVTSCYSLFSDKLELIYLIFPGVLPGKKVEWSKGAGL